MAIYSFRRNPTQHTAQEFVVLTYALTRALKLYLLGVLIQGGDFFGRIIGPMDGIYRRWHFIGILNNVDTHTVLLLFLSYMVTF